MAWVLWCEGWQAWELAGPGAGPRELGQGSPQQSAGSLGASAPDTRTLYALLVTLPCSYVVRNYGWSAYFSALLAACAGAILLLAPAINAKSYIQVGQLLGGPGGGEGGVPVPWRWGGGL